MNKSDLINFYLESAIKDCELTNECLGRTIDKSYKILIYILVSINFCIGIIINNNVNHIIVETMLLFSSINFIIGIVLLFLNLKGFTIKSCCPSVKSNLLDLLQTNELINKEDINYLQVNQIKDLYHNREELTKQINRATRVTNICLLSCTLNFLVSIIYFAVFY